MPERPYTYYDFTLSLCPQCLRRIEAKIVFEDGNVYMLKRCPEHGRQKVRIATDIEYYKSIYTFPSSNTILASMRRRHCGQRLRVKS